MMCLDNRDGITRGITSHIVLGKIMSHEKIHFHVQMSAKFILLNKDYKQQSEPSITYLSFNLSFMSDNSHVIIG